MLVFSAATRATLPVDTHLFRVVDRLGLANHAGRNTKTVREHLIAELLRYGPDLAPAHFVFLLVGRSTCVAGTPHCDACFLAPTADTPPDPDGAIMIDIAVIAGTPAPVRPVSARGRSTWR